MSELEFRMAAEDDVDGVHVLLRRCLTAMRQAGIEQWDEIYPTADVIRSDIAAGTMYLGLDREGIIVGVAVLNEYQDPEYADVPWAFEDEAVAVVHRVMVDPDAQGRGIARTMMQFIERLAVERGYRVLRLDAFTANPRALRLYRGLGYHDAGGIVLRKGPFRCFEKRL